MSTRLDAESGVQQHLEVRRAEAGDGVLNIMMGTAHEKAHGCKGQIAGRMRTQPGVAGKPAEHHEFWLLPCVTSNPTRPT
jgi:hypothetical protein